MHVKQAFLSTFVLSLVVLYFSYLKLSKLERSEIVPKNNKDLLNKLIDNVSELETNDQFMNRMRKRMNKRREITKHACEKYGLGKTKFTKQLFMEAKKFNFLYCRIPKAGSGNMGRLFRDLIDLKDYEQLNTGNKDINDPHVYEFITQRYLNDTKLIQNYTTFMITRDPFVRIVSSYQKKIAGYKGPSDVVVNETWKGMRKIPTNVSFPDFIAHLLYKDRKDNTLERHWALYYNLCQPCHIQYDVIANLETIEEDTRYLLNLIGAPKNVSYSNGYGKKGKSTTTKNLYMSLYSQVSKEKRIKLFKLFEPDFRIFNYTVPPYIN